MQQSPGHQPDLDSQTVRFTIKAATNIRAGDTLIVRETRDLGDSVEISAIPEKVVRDEAAKIFS
jgi:hypothetical protein